MDFKELLKSFGLDMDSVASALGIDIDTLNNMDQQELLNLLTQQSNWEELKPPQVFLVKTFLSRLYLNKCWKGNLIVFYF